MGDWHEDDAFWEDFAPTFDERLERAEIEAEEIANLLALAPPAKVLDLPCGVGRHTLALARRGYAVTGIDRSDRYLSTARARAREAGIEACFERGDLRDAGDEAAFDAVINLWTSFGYFRDPAEDARAARNFLRVLRPGGALVMELMGKEVLARVFRARDWKEGADGTICLTETEILDGWTWVRTRWEYLAREWRRRHVVEHRVYSFAELRAVLEGAGFVGVEGFGSLGGAPYDHQASRLVVRACRPG